MKNLLTILIIATSTIALSQNHIDLANVYWRTSPFNSIDGSTEKRHFNMYVADAKLPVVINDKNVFITGLEYQHNSIQQVNSSSVFDMSFASSTLQLGWEHKWNDRSKMLFMSFTRLNTDYVNVDATHLQFGGLAFGTTERTDDFHWKYGLYYNGEFFGPMFVPLFGFNWKINDKWRLKTVIPINLELAYQPKDGIRTGLRFDGVNGSYRVSPIVPGSFAPAMYMDKADNNLWYFGEFEVAKNCWLHFKAGYSVLRKYRIYLNQEQLDLKLGPVNVGDDRPPVSPLFKNGLSFETRFIYRLPL